MKEKSFYWNFKSQWFPPKETLNLAGKLLKLSNKIELGYNLIVKYIHTYAYWQVHIYTYFPLLVVSESDADLSRLEGENCNS